jgi:putative addiction module component (TIGR02574 family)
MLFGKMSTQISDFLQLTVAERIQLVEDIWDSVAAFPESVPLTGPQKRELDQRMQEFRDDPDEGISWAELKKTLLNSK